MPPRSDWTTVETSEQPPPDALRLDYLLGGMRDVIDQGRLQERARGTMLAALDNLRPLMAGVRLQQFDDQRPTLITRLEAFALTDSILVLWHCSLDGNFEATGEVCGIRPLRRVTDLSVRGVERHGTGSFISSFAIRFPEEIVVDTNVYESREESPGAGFRAVRSAMSR